MKSVSENHGGKKALLEGKKDLLERQISREDIINGLIKTINL